ncbi:family 43 glycosylhydrolase [Luteolibacter sp. Populi]|uniref:family 43 glycosylhydrolase n=1 Tax=Luteolibacter sp. Populi TaxID=3230487 RepID=UPI003466DDD8
MRLLILATLLPLLAQANPILDGADPHAAVVGKNYWLFPTEARSRDPIFAAYRSTDLRTWKREGTILDLDKIPWVKADGAPWHGAWAPALATKNGKFYFYYSVGPQHPTPSRIGVASGPSPTGPFTDSGKPLLTGFEGFEAIDPMVFVDPAGGKAWFYVGGSAGAKLRVFEMAADMISFKREVEITQPEKFTEGAFMHLRGKTYYLSYSHGKWNDSTYSVHYATAPSPTGPWQYRGCILQSDDKHQGPGHHSFIENPGTKEWFIVYHRWETGKKDPPFRGGRKLAIEKITYDAKGLIQPIKMTDAKPPVSVIRR